jgi:hypothetical protein
MIHATRPLPSPEAALAALKRPSTRTGLTERAEAELHYSAVPPPVKAFEFSRYREVEVCKALNQVFNGKCAYCESPYLAVDALDVEHFRPKGGVEEAPHHPGYWWLASDWTNLLPSCPACNQRRRHVEYEPGMTLEEIERALLSKPANTTGKANAFPLLDKNWVTNIDGDLTVEDPLLINPCENDPETHLEWVFDRKGTPPIWEADPIIPFVRPRLRDGIDSLHGEASIAIFGLNRVEVVRPRIEQVRKIQGTCPAIVDTVIDLAALGNDNSPRADKLRERLQRYRRSLMRFTAPQEHYAGMARAFVREFDSDLLKLAR